MLLLSGDCQGLSAVASPCLMAEYACLVDNSYNPSSVSMHNVLAPDPIPSDISILIQGDV